MREWLDISVTVNGCLFLDDRPLGERGDRFESSGFDRRTIEGDGR
jgi:hypothetical protein